MHALIDDFAWIALGLAVLTVLFMIGAGFILLDEGLKTLIQSVRRHLEDARRVRANGSHRSVPATTFHELCLKFHVARRNTFPRFRPWHHKP
jgi:hypothetical protein